MINFEEIDNTDDYFCFLILKIDKKSPILGVYLILNEKNTFVLKFNQDFCNICS